MHYHRLLILLLLCVFIGWGCGKDDQPERLGVTVMGGLTLEQACDTKRLKENARLSRQYGLDSWLVETTLDLPTGESMGESRYYERNILDTVLTTINYFDLRYSLAFEVRNPHDVEPSEVAFEHVLTHISAMLLRTRRKLPERIVFIGDIVEGKGREMLMGFLREFRSEFREYEGKIVLALPAQDAFEEGVWEGSDEIGLVFFAPPDGDEKYHYKRLNTKLKELAKTHEKPVFIVHSNLMGGDPLRSFRSQLSFWGEETDLSGIVLNSLYCDFSVGDYESRIGLAKHEAFLSYLMQYTQGDL